VSYNLNLNSLFEELFKTIFNGLFDGENKISKILGFDIFKLDVIKNIKKTPKNVDLLLFVASLGDHLTNYFRNGQVIYRKLSILKKYNID